MTTYGYSARQCEIDMFGFKEYMRRRFPATLDPDSKPVAPEPVAKRKDG